MAEQKRKEPAQALKHIEEKCCMYLGHTFRGITQILIIPMFCKEPDIPMDRCLEKLKILHTPEAFAHKNSNPEEITRDFYMKKLELLKFPYFSWGRQPQILRFPANL